MSGRTDAEIVATDPVELMAGRKYRITLAFDQTVPFDTGGLGDAVLDAIEAIAEERDLPILTISAQWDGDAADRIEELSAVVAAVNAALDGWEGERYVWNGAADACVAAVAKAVKR